MPHYDDGNGALDDHMRQWVDAGLLSPDQAAAIAVFERGRRSMPERRLRVAVEVAAFVGSVLALMGGAAAVGPNWDRIPVGGRVLIGITVTVVGLLVGRGLLSLGEPGGDRLGAFLHVVARPAVALAVAALVIAFALVDGLLPLLVAGVLGALVATQALLLTTLTGPIASAIVALSGIVIIVVAANRATRPGRGRVTSS